MHGDLCKHLGIDSSTNPDEVLSEYNQEIPQSHTADQHTAP